MPVFSIPRRAVLAGAAALPLAGLRPALAAEQVTIATWGGDYANLLRANVDEPLMAPQGITVVQDTGDEDPRVAKLYAQRRLPRGSVDVACVQAVRGNELSTSGLLEPLDATKVPNLAHVPPFLRTDNFAPHIYSLQVLIHNPATVPNPQDPATFTNSKLNWSEVNEDGHAELHELYRSLLRLRAGRPDLMDPDLRTVSVNFDEVGRWLVLHRGDTAVALNFADAPREMPVPFDGRPKVLLETAPAELYGGAVQLPAYGAAVLAAG